METDGKVSILSFEIPRYSQTYGQPAFQVDGHCKGASNLNGGAKWTSTGPMSRANMPTFKYAAEATGAQSALLGALTLLRANFRAHDKYQDKTGSLWRDILRRVKIKWL